MWMWVSGCLPASQDRTGPHTHLACALRHAEHAVPLALQQLAHKVGQAMVTPQLEGDLRDEAHIHHACRGDGGKGSERAWIFAPQVQRGLRYGSTPTRPAGGWAA